MYKLSLIVIIALTGSLALNAWLYTRQAQQKQDADTSQGSRPSIVGDRKGNSMSRAPAKADGGQSVDPLVTPGGAAPGDLASIMAIRDPMERSQALLEFARTLPSDRIGDMLKELRASGKKLDPEASFIAHLLLTRWGREDPDAAFASLGDVNAKQGGGDALTILAGLAATDPARAVAWLTDPDNDMSQQPYLDHMMARTVATEWARQDPEAAMAWAASLPGGQRGGAYSGIIGSILESDPERAAAVALDLDPADRPKLLGEIARTWARQAPEQAVDWANALEGRDRAEALSDALAGWAQTAPENAADYVDLLPEDERGNHVGSLARTWAQQAPAEAAQWLSSQPEGEGKADAMGHVMWNWTTNDPEAASAWLAEQPRGERL